jgi:hypothetical protein
MGEASGDITPSLGGRPSSARRPWSPGYKGGGPPAWYLGALGGGSAPRARYRRGGGTSNVVSLR